MPANPLFIVFYCGLLWGLERTNASRNPPRPPLHARFRQGKLGVCITFLGHEVDNHHKLIFLCTPTRNTL